MKKRDKGRKEERKTEKELQRHGKMSGLGMAVRAYSTFHADTACPPCKIKRVHGALCHDRNSQAVHAVFFIPISLPYQIGQLVPFTSRLILARTVTLKRDKASSMVDIVIFRYMPCNTMAARID